MSMSPVSRMFGGCLGLLFGGLCLSIAIWQTVSSHREVAGWETVEGHVISHETEAAYPGASPFTFARVGFVTHDGQARVFISRVSGSFLPAVGSDVPVTYHPENPSRARLVSYRLRIYLVIGLLGGCLWLGAGWLFYKARSERSRA